MSKSKFKASTRRLINRSLDFLAGVFAPIVKLIAKKMDDVVDLTKATDDLEELYRQEPVLGDAQEVDEYAEKLAKQDEVVSRKARKTRAFADKPPEVRDDFWRAADYTDEWFHVPGDGLRFRTFYLCMGGGNDNPCGCVQLSASWARFKEDALAPGQRWYCKVCSAKYKVRYGVLVEMVKENQTFYLKGQFPPEDIGDLKRMAVEQGMQKHKDLDTARKFLESLPHAHPCSENHFFKTQFEGVYRLDPEFLAELPMFNWDLVYRSVGEKK